MVKAVSVSLGGLALLLLGACAYIQHPKFGAHPKGERLERIVRSPHYADGVFHNTVDTPVLVEGVSTLSVVVGNLLDPGENRRPAQPLPRVDSDLSALNGDGDRIIWLGHSSYFLRFAGKRILIDPVLSDYAAPVSFSTRAFPGTSLFTAEEMPEVDLLLITHDHWDHLDHATLSTLMPKVDE
ncbi:MBL fold metallo-hydrolase [Motiliproteus sp. SC1-56]|uniref:MBL fold metallo-hydrolase n=1 Tax=Motiliproteus sp. SC1-56 TaxID=2799565 RepID=UPI001A8D29E9|nr:MBL fold metallo-hydrolase [Motiliproteus sp. SC1-56]